MPTPWTELRAALDPFTRRFGYYTAYRLHPAEFIGDGVFQHGIPSAARWLRSMGYRPNWVSAAKRHPETGQLHDLSYRKIPDSHPPNLDEKRITDFGPAQCQFHVHAFDMGERIEFFSHYETRPIMGWTHYRPEYNSTYLRGVTDLDL